MILFRNYNLPQKNLLSFFVFTLSLWTIPQVSSAQNSWEAPEEAQKLTNPLERSEKVLNAGKQIFTQICATCHGKTGKGDGPGASALESNPANLTSKAVQKQSDGALYWKIQEGRPPMPTFKSQLSDQQIWAIVHYIRSLSSKNK